MLSNLRNFIAFSIYKVTIIISIKTVIATSEKYTRSTKCYNLINTTQ
jgi:hypothetical protein